MTPKEQDEMDIKWFEIMKQVWREDDKDEPEVVQFTRMMIPLAMLVNRRNGRDN